MHVNNKITFTHKELLRQLDYNSLTGYFYWNVSNSSQIKIGDIAGTKQDGYICIQINGRKYQAHRLAYFYVHGYMPENDIDHKDQIKYHNWISNLREVSKQCNQRNCSNPKNNISGIKGVSWNAQRGKWIAMLSLNNKNFNLGGYELFDNAVCARLAGEQCLNWSKCDTNSPAFKYVKESIQRRTTYAR